MAQALRGPLQALGRTAGDAVAIKPVTRRQALATIGAAAGSLAAPAVLRGRFRLFAQSQGTYSARAVKLVEETVVTDLLNQFRFPDYRETPVKVRQWIAKPGSFTRADFETYRTSGIRVFALGWDPLESTCRHASLSIL